MYKFPSLLAIFLILFSFSLLPRPVRAAPAPVTILLYHYIADNPNPADKTRNSLSVSPDNFAKQMKELKDMGYTTLTLNQLPDYFAGNIYAAKPLVLTFDDGYDNFYTNALPVLKKYNFKSVIFISTANLGGGYFMTWDQIRDAYNSGLVEVESHGNTHVSFTGLSPLQLQTEMETSRSLIQQNLGETVNFISYPNGAVNDTVIQAAQTAGYIGGVGVWGGKATEISMNMPRTRVGNVPSFAGFLR